VAHAGERDIKRDPRMFREFEGISDIRCVAGTAIMLEVG